MNFFARFKMTSLFLPVLGASVAGLAAGCAPSPNGDGTGEVTTQSQDDSPPGAGVGAPSEGLTKKATDFFEYSTAVSGRDVIGASTHLCVLTGVQGDFSDYDRGSMHLDWATYNYWEFYAVGGASGYAVCTNWNNFSAPAGGWRGVSSGASATLRGNADATVQASGWQGDAISFVSGVEGEMEGSGEYVQTLQSTTIPGNSTLRVHSEVGNFFDYTALTGWSQSVFVGVPQQHLVRLLGYNTAGAMVRATISDPGTYEFAVSNVSGYSGYWLSSVNDGVCALTHVSGNFDGGGEWTQIYQQSGTWFLKASGAAGKGIYGRARCMAYNQI